MDPVTLIVTALAAGAASALQDDAKGVVGAALTRLRALVKKRLSGQPGAEVVLAKHERKPELYAEPLADELTESGAGEDAELVSAAQDLMKLVDAGGAAAGKYVVSVRDSSGVQIGDNNSQVNNFGQQTAGRDFYRSGADMFIDRSGDR
jgi:hypothetical protein